METRKQKGFLIVIHDESFMALNDEKIFYFSLTLSSFLHLAYICSSLNFSSSPPIEAPPPVETVYYEMKHVPLKNEKILHEIPSFKQKEEKYIPSIASSESLEFEHSFLENMDRLPPPMEGHAKDALQQNVMTIVKKTVTVSLLDTMPIKSKEYDNYLTLIRNKIKQKVNHYGNPSLSQQGEVYFTFIIAADGSLRKIKIIDQKSDANNNQKSIGLRSIKESSPFPAFPDEIQYPVLTFSVQISFQSEE